MATSTTPRTRPAGAATAARILDAAERLFAERGFRGTTLRAVSEAVGIQNPSLYNHFDSKSALYEAVLERAIGPVLHEFWDTENEIEKVVRHLAARPRVAQLLLHETLAGGPRLTPIVTRWIAEVVALSTDFMAKRRPTPIDRTALTLRVLAMYHVVAGYCASAPLYRALTGSDLLAEAALARQVEIVRAMSDALFADAGGAV